MRSLNPKARVVLLDDAGRPVGSADRDQVHGPTTPYHLAFSCYVFDFSGRLLVTRRSIQKRTWPGTWSNSCCGHPQPGEEPTAAVTRRVREELGVEPMALTLALPTFRYRARANGIEENELCPVFLCRAADTIAPDPTEVGEWRWLEWVDFVAWAKRADCDLSPWSRTQARLLEDGGLVARFLNQSTEAGSNPPP